MSAKLKLAVLGPRQSGKTCLAVGLSAVNTPEFAVTNTNIGSDLGKLKVDLQSGIWPPANNKGDAKTIELSFLRKGKEPISVEFLEFAGERIQNPEDFKTFANAHLKDLDGVVIVVNPGTDAFSGDKEARQSALEDYQRIFTWFRSKEKKPFVALTVTAADRIAEGGDLVDRSDDVSKFIAELKNSLDLSGFKNERFDVTVTGHLAAQNQPTLAEGMANTSANPFLWILDKLAPKPAPFPWRIIAITIAIVAVIAGIFCAVKCKVERERIEKQEGLLKQLLEDNDASISPTKETLDAVCEAFGALGRPLSLRFRPVLAAIAPPTTETLTKAVELLVPLYDSSQKLARQKATELEPRVWELFKRRIDRDVGDLKDDASRDATNVTEEAIRKIDGLFTQFVPKLSQDAVDGHGQMRKEWEVVKKQLRENRLTGVLIGDVLQPLIAIAVRHGESELLEIFRLYGKLAEISVPQECADLVAKKAEVAQKLDSRMGEEIRWMSQRDLGVGLPKEKAEVAAQSLLGRLGAWTPITAEGEKAKMSLEAEVKAKADESVEIWLAEQRKICEDWIKSEIDNQPKRPVAGNGGLWSAYKAFARRNSENPYFVSVIQAAVYVRAEAVFESDMQWFRANGGGTATLWKDSANFSANWKKVIERFDAFRQLCREVVEVPDDMKPVMSRQSSWAWHFAWLCYTDGKLGQNMTTYSDAFPQRLVIDKIEASADYHGDLPYQYKYTTFGAKVLAESFNVNGTRASGSTVVLLPFEKDGYSAKDSTDNAVKASNHKKHGAEKKVFEFSPGRFIDIHAFERVTLQLVATDWNKGTGAHQSCPVQNIPLVWGEGWTVAGNGKRFDLSFKLDRWSGAKKPELSLAIRGHVEGSSIPDLLNQAKAAARMAVRSAAK